MRLVIIIICIILVPFFGLALYALFEAIRRNFHMITKGEAYRSAQMNAARLQRCIKKYQIKSILNLRGEARNEKWYDDEIKVSAEHGVLHYDIFLSNDCELTPEEFDSLIALFKSAPRPILIHCLGGADRSGLVAALWKMIVDEESKSVARRQLNIWYGHLPFGKAAAMDRCFKNWRPEPEPMIENNGRNFSLNKVRVLLKNFLARFFV